MKKSMIATAVVATAGLAASANAGYFSISNASVVGGTLTTPTGTGAFELALNGASATDAGASEYSGSASNSYTISNTTANSIASTIGLSGNGNMAYFGYEGGAGGPGYFGIAFIGNGSVVDMQMGNASIAAGGVHSNINGGFATTTSSTWQTGGFGVTTTNGQAYVAIFARMGVGQEMGAGTVSDTNFNVRYLDFDGTNWSTVASATGVSSSSLNTATYNVPVPAPALLAGAGLVGAAALRRRMAKKA